MARVSEFVAAMNEVTASTGEATGRVDTTSPISATPPRAWSAISASSPSSSTRMAAISPRRSR